MPTRVNREEGPLEHQKSPEKRTQPPASQTTHRLNTETDIDVDNGRIEGHT